MADAGGTSLHVDNLTRNVEAAHLAEVFAHYGTVTGVDLPTKDGLPLGFAHVEMGTAEEAVNAQAFLDGGQLDGNMLRVNTVLVPVAATSLWEHTGPVGQADSAGDWVVPLLERRLRSGL